MKRWVVIPTLDARERLLRTLASLEQQTVPADVVVVDNASIDGTAEAVAARHPHVRVVAERAQPRLRRRDQPRGARCSHPPTATCSCS